MQGKGTKNGESELITVAEQVLAGVADQCPALSVI